MLQSAFQRATRTAARTMLAASTRRQASSTPAFVKYKRNLKTESFYKKNWLSDSSTYPIIVTLGGALCMMLGVSTSCLMYNPDVQINPNTRGSVIRPK